jgi:tetratricopeptide (TPR) repeat protein
MRYSVVFLFIIFSWASLSAQDADTGILSLIQKPGVQSEDVKIKDTPEYERASAIYRSLVKARGDVSAPMPEFVMSKGERYAVWTDSAKMEIGLEEKAFEAAEALGEESDATVAAMLAGQLVHFYEKHNKKRDYTGGFLAYSAGYGVFEKWPELMDGIYKSYSLPEDLEGFPGLGERKKLLQDATAKLHRLVEVFEMGNLLTAISRYEDAYKYYSFVLEDFQNPEILNNAGVTAVLNALSYFRPTEREVRFRFPLELDLKSVGGRDLKDFKEIRDRILREAIRHFDAAILKDTSYAPAYLNKACAYALLGDVERAESYANVEAQQTAARPGYEKTALDLQVLLGILHEWKGDTEKATEAFQAAADKNNALALHNLNVLQGNSSPPRLSSGFAMGIETIDNMDLADTYNLPEVVPDSEIEVDEQIRFYHNLNPGPNSRFYLTHNAGSGRYIYFLLTGPGYAGQTAGKLKAGAAPDEIEAVYRQPLRTIETPTRQILVYPAIIMILGKDRKLARWAIYGEGE